MPKLFIILDKCVNNGTEQISCPYAGSGRTVGAGYAMDYFCKLVPDKKETYGFKLTSGYVEWEWEIDPIPDWCPIMCIEDKMVKKFES